MKRHEMFEKILNYLHCCEKKGGVSDIERAEGMLELVEEYMVPKTHYGTECGEYFDLDEEDLKYIEEMTTYRIGWEPENE
jgi:hypothetical protein